MLHVWEICQEIHYKHLEYNARRNLVDIQVQVGIPYKLLWSNLRKKVEVLIGTYSQFV